MKRRTKMSFEQIYKDKQEVGININSSLDERIAASEAGLKRLIDTGKIPDDLVPIYTKGTGFLNLLDQNHGIKEAIIIFARSNGKEGDEEGVYVNTVGGSSPKTFSFFVESLFENMDKVSQMLFVLNAMAKIKGDL
jgi:hypothetical protein